MTSLAHPPPAPHTLNHHAPIDRDQQRKQQDQLLSGSKPLTLKSLLENPIEFVKAKVLGRDEQVPYKAINQKGQPSSTPTASSSTSTSTSASNQPVASTSTVKPSTSSTIFPPIDPSPAWARPYPVGSGLQNVGNTCFLNSALQCLIHTPPLVRYLESQGPGSHPSDQNCGMKKSKGFCMTCSMRSIIKQSFSTPRKRAYTPSIVVKNLKQIAKHLRFGRQEDSHEFLRFVIDAMQLSSLHGRSPKLTTSQKNQNPIHQLFGGVLRSRVHCTSCTHNSDTFDAMLDLSLDLGNRAGSIKDGLENLVRMDILKGQNKYRCEKCKKLVVAEKQFLIEKSPLVLTIHLKRFTPTGRKVGGFIKYPEVLNLKGYMTDKNSAPSYRLYALILHSGSGPHSGHYTSLVRSGKDSKFYDMNDESVSPLSSGVPLTQKNAYCLFYVREKGDLLKGVIGVEGGEGKKKRRRESGEEGEKVERPKQKRKESFLGSTYTPGEGPKPPMIATSSKVSSPPKLNSTLAAPTNSFNPFVTTTPSSASTAVEPSPPAATNQSSGLEATAMKKKMEKLQAKRTKLYESKQPPQFHSHSNGHGHGGGRGGGRGGKKVVHQMRGRNKPRVIN